jgi:hypothetical protein
MIIFPFYISAKNKKKLSRGKRDDFPDPFCFPIVFPQHENFPYFIFFFKSDMEKLSFVSSIF